MRPERGTWLPSGTTMPTPGADDSGGRATSALPARHRSLKEHRLDDGKKMTVGENVQMCGSAPVTTIAIAAELCGAVSIVIMKQGRSSAQRETTHFELASEGTLPRLHCFASALEFRELQVQNRMAPVHQSQVHFKRRGGSMWRTCASVLCPIGLQRPRTPCHARYLLCKGSCACQEQKAISNESMPLFLQARRYSRTVPSE